MNSSITFSSENTADIILMQTLWEMLRVRNKEISRQYVKDGGVHLLDNYGWLLDFVLDCHDISVLNDIENTGEHDCRICMIERRRGRKMPEEWLAVLRG